MIGTILAIFYLHVTLMLPSKFGVNWSFGFRRRSKKIDFQDGCHGGHLGFPIGTILAISDLQVTPMLPSKFGVNRFKRRSEKYISFHFLGFLIGTMLVIFYLQVTPMLPSKFGVSWPFGSGEEAKNRFSRWRPWRPS